MSLFVMCYRKYIKRNNLKHFDKNLVKFLKSNGPRKLEDKKKKEMQVTCYKCGKIEY